MTETTPAATFRHRLRARDLLVGTWVKTPAPVVCEVLAGTGLDVLTLDAEHAPFGRAELDACLAICRASGVPALVRVPSADPAQILNALDGGWPAQAIAFASTALLLSTRADPLLLLVAGAGIFLALHGLG